jgi:hypothetical protein
MRGRSTHRGWTKRLLGLETLESRTLLSVVPPTVTDVVVSSTQWSQSFLDYLETSGVGDRGYAIPVGSSAQSTSLPWVNLNQILISFSEDVRIDAADLSLSGVDSGSFSFSGFLYDPITHQATWTLENMLATGRFLLDLDANGLDPVTDLSGNILDGEWTDEVSSYSSGNGVAGGDFEFAFNVLPGDINGSGVVQSEDLSVLLNLWNQSTTDAYYDYKADISGDGIIQTGDLSVVLNSWGKTIPAAEPAGRYNDAPTTSGFDLIAISNRDLDTTLSLDSVFDDLEDSDSELIYSISGITNSELFDVVSIDAETGVLTLNTVGSESSMSPLPSGRSTITLTAIDTGGLSVSFDLTVDIDYVNQPPVISDYIGYTIGSDVWVISGTVTDADDDVEGLIVELSGVFDVRVAVQADGTFYYSTILSPWWLSGWESAITVDQHGGISNGPDVYIGLT